MLKLTAVLIVALGVAHPVPVSASEVELQWRAPQGCPERDQVLRDLARHVGRELRVGAGAALLIDAEIAVHEAGYELILGTRSPAGAEQRELHAKTCVELARASVLMAALLIGPEPEPELPRPAENQRSLLVTVRARAVGDLGTLPSLSVGPGLAAGVAWQRMRLELAGLLLPAQTLRASGASQLHSELQLMAAGVNVCRELFESIHVGTCLQLEVGRWRASGASAAALWWLTALSLRGGLRVFEAVYLVADVALGVPWVRPRVAIHGEGTLHEVPALIGRLELSVEARL